MGRGGGWVVDFFRGCTGCNWGASFGSALGEYPVFRVLRIMVPPLRRVTLANAGVPAQPKVTKGPCPDVRPSLRLGFLRSGFIRGHRLRFASLHLLSMLSPYESLHSASRRALRSRSKAGELTLGLVVGVGLPRFHVGAAEGCDLLIFVGFAPHPSPLPRERGPMVGFSKSVFGSISHVGVPHPITPISPLSLWERARVRVCFWLF